MKYILMTLILGSSIHAKPKVIELESFDTSKLSISDRLKDYMSDGPSRSYKLPFSSYQIIYDSNESDSEDFLKDLSSYTNLEIRTSYQTDIYNLNPVVEKMFPSISLTKTPVYHSYNCHNTSLLTQGFLKRQNYSTKEEIEFYLKNFCGRVHELDANVVGINESTMLSHSFTAISKNFIFDKPKNSALSPYRFVPIYSTDGFRLYSCDSKKFHQLKCQKTKELEDEIEAIDTYFSNYVVDLQNDHQKVSKFKRLTKIESDLTRIMYTNKSCSLIQQSLLERINSLKSMYEAFPTSNIYGGGIGKH